MGTGKGKSKGMIRWAAFAEARGPKSTENPGRSPEPREDAFVEQPRVSSLQLAWPGAECPWETGRWLWAQHFCMYVAHCDRPASRPASSSRDRRGPGSLRRKFTVFMLVAGFAAYPGPSSLLKKHILCPSTVLARSGTPTVAVMWEYRNTRPCVRATMQPLKLEECPRFPAAALGSLPDGARPYRT